MALGEGKYQKIAEAVSELTEAEGVMLLVICGNQGSSMCAIMSPERAAQNIEALKNVIAEMEKDLEQIKEDEDEGSTQG